MPRQPTLAEIRLNNTAACLTPALTLNELHDGFGPPFIRPITNIIRILIDTVLVIIAENPHSRNLLDLSECERNKNECAQLIKNIPQVVYTIVQLHIKSGTAGSIPPAMMDHIGRFMEYSASIYTFIEAQQDGNKLKRLFRNNETNNLLKDCHARLQQALDMFKVYLGSNELKNSSNSFSMLPSKLKIFHGQESELRSIMAMLSQQWARIAILGGAGMGKTSLARVVLHHPHTSAKFAHKFFVSAESANSIELAALIGLHVGLNPGQDLTNPVIQYFSKKPACLLILDNLETVWESMQSRGASEEFLSLLTEVEALSLITRSQCEGWKDQQKFNGPIHFYSLWSHYNVYTTQDINQLLRFTDNMPLAIDLIAHVVDYEGLANVLTCWETEKTSPLSLGFDRSSNLGYIHWTISFKSSHHIR
ncbi:hypothetical protein B0H14DRAFT_2591837 [Mycena olivaceomarginata]|nr:hypothetical protein B0H14DRAFT_2591837 [Mycena olivaceomarginata]